jgi:phage repressor protein C with HTH and peptisase S24 domain
MRGVAAATAPQDAFQTIEIQRYNISLSAGHGNFTDWAEPLDKIPFTQDFFTRRLRRKPENMVIVDANGDSMSPTIADDDLVMIDTKDHSLTGAIWAFSYGESLFIKRLNILPDALEVCSDNSRDYRPFIIDGEKMANVNLIGRVVWVGRSL